MDSTPIPWIETWFIHADNMQHSINQPLPRRVIFVFEITLSPLEYIRNFSASDISNTVCVPFLRKKYLIASPKIRSNQFENHNISAIYISFFQWRVCVCFDCIFFVWWMVLSGGDGSGPKNARWRRSADDMSGFLFMMNLWRRTLKFCTPIRQ